MDRTAKSSEDAQDALKEMEHLVYVVSHDFRQPLRIMSSYAELLQRNYALDEEGKEMAAFIVEGANEMKTLIEDLLTYSRIKTSPERRMVSLNSPLQWATLKLQNTIRDSGAEILHEDLPEAIVNESQFAQLFEQLISNAIKFRGANRPKIEVTAEETSETYLVSVRDNGTGIEAKHQDDIFVPFKRLHGKDVPGSGLGLAVCRKIVRAHGGRIWVESEGREGSIFKFTIPY